MKLKLFFLTGFLFLIGLISFGYFKSVPRVENKENPQIQVNPSSFSFGEIQYGKIVKQSFKVKNTGKKVLEINRVSTSCSCTSAKIGKESLLPNEETDLYMTYNTGLMSGSHAKGNQERIIYLRSNDPINPQTEVTINAYVK